MIEAGFLDSYCERLSAIFGSESEPLNSISNIGFIICALLLLTAYYRTTSFSWKTFDIFLLSILVGAIGIGSSLWHFYGTAPYLLGDIIPITLFLNLYLFTFLIRIAKVSIKQTFIAWLLFQGVTYVCQTYLPPNLLNGTIMYIPAFFILCIMVLYVTLTFHAATLAMVKASAIWMASLFFRTIDLNVCSFFPIGTHFIWHLLNAIVLYRLVMVVLKFHTKTKE